MRLHNHNINAVVHKKRWSIETEAKSGYQMVSGTIEESIEVHDNYSSSYLVSLRMLASPTAPGHSPAVGHVLCDKGVDKNYLNNRKY